MRRAVVASLALALALASAARVARAGDEGDGKKNDRERKKLEEKQAKGGEKPGAGKSDKAGEGEKGAPASDDEENPLPKILDLMKEVESRLNDQDLEEITQLDQKRMVEAMKFEEKTRTALDDLIKKLEEKT